MPHDLNSDSHWHEPTGLTKKAGLGTFKKPPMPYDVFMEEQEIPIVRAVGVSKVQNLPLKPWKRMGGKGSFIQLWGTEGLWGSYVVEVPGSGALNTNEVEAMLPRIRQHVHIPVGVGFGIRDAQTARAIGSVSDAVVIGSRLVQLLEDAPREKAVEALRAFIADIRQALDA